MYGINYVKIPSHRTGAWAPKLGSEIETTLLTKCLEIKTVLRLFTAQGQHKVYHRRTGGLYWKVFTDFPLKFRSNGKPGRSSTETSFSVQTAEILKPVVAVLSSNLFWSVVYYYNKLPRSCTVRYPEFSCSRNRFFLIRNC